MLVEIGIAVIAIGTAVLAYYVKDVTDKVLKRHFELKEELTELESKFHKLKTETEKSLRTIGSDTTPRVREELMSEIRKIQEKLRQFEKISKDLQKIETKIDYETGNLRMELDKTKQKLESLESAISLEKEEIKEELKRELLKELEEEIEHLEETIERRKEQEIEEFLDMITVAITLQPEKLSAGLMEAKRALLSLRDIAKIFVLTGKGKKEFEDLKETLIELLKNLRKLAVVSLPEEEVYSAFNDVIVRVKRLGLPIKVVRDGKEKELSPEKSFIQIHKTIYELAGQIDRIAEMINEPVPVTPIEKEFYEKLRKQFEELKKLEEQVQFLMLRLGERVADKGPENKGKLDKTLDARGSRKGDKSVEEILKELNLL